MLASDEELVARAVTTRDERAFAELVRRHQSGIRNWMRHLAGDADRGDELAQDAFVRAWDKLDTFSGRGTFRAWIMRIAYNEFLGQRRRLQRDRRLGDAYRADPVMTETTIHGAMESGVTDLPRMLAVLSDDERTAMILNYAYGMSHGEVSEITGMPLGTVKSHVTRGRNKIREKFLAQERGK